MGTCLIAYTIIGKHYYGEIVMFHILDLLFLNSSILSKMVEQNIPTNGLLLKTIFNPLSWISEVIMPFKLEFLQLKNVTILLI